MVSIMKLPTATRKLNWEDYAPYLMEPEPEAEEQHESERTEEGSGSEAPSNDDKENKMRQVRWSAKLRFQITFVSYQNGYDKMLREKIVDSTSKFFPAL